MFGPESFDTVSRSTIVAGRPNWSGRTAAIANIGPVEVPSTWVVVTGAGASRNLGYEGKELALMPDWARRLVEELDRLAYGLAEAIGLKRQQDGQEFEDRLGHLLAWVSSIETTRSLVEIGTTPVGPPKPDVETWFDTSTQRAKDIVRVIHAVLFDLFGKAQVSTFAAMRAYEVLFNSLDIGNEDRLVYATTNYDVAGEIALEELGRIPDWGEPKTLNNSTFVHTEDLRLTGNPKRVPVLHLHGRVNWYYDDRGRVVASDPGSPFDPQRGAPALLLPDPKKDYTQDAFVASLWDRFREAFSEAGKVIVLGHSLHDDNLVDVLKGVSPTNTAVTIAIRGDIVGAPATEMVEDFEWVRSRLPGVHVIPMLFGPQLTVGPAALARFLAGEAAPQDFAY